MTTTEDAHLIYQTHLDEMSHAVAQRDFGAYALLFRLPHRLETLEGTVCIETLDQLEQFFDTICAQLERNSVPLMDRNCIVAEFTDPDTITGYHQTRLVRDDAFVIESYAGLCTLRRTGGFWCLTVSQFAEAEGAMPSTVLQRYMQRDIARRAEGVTPATGG